MRDVYLEAMSLVHATSAQPVELAHLVALWQRLEEERSAKRAAQEQSDERLELLRREIARRCAA